MTCDRHAAYLNAGIVVSRLARKGELKLYYDPSHPKEKQCVLYVNTSLQDRLPTLTSHQMAALNSVNVE